MDERFNDVERDFDLKFFFEMGLITILLSEKYKMKKNDDDDDERKCVRRFVRHYVRCRIWIFQLNLYYSELNVNLCMLNFFFFSPHFWINSFWGSRARSFIFQKADGQSIYIQWKNNGSVRPQFCSLDHIYSE